jgi:hypothetical protein
MAMVVLLVPHAAGEASLGPESLHRLAELGITNVALVRDEQATGFVLEGWAFDPDRSTDAAVMALAGSAEGARTLHPLTQMAVSPNATQPPAAKRRRRTEPLPQARSDQWEES